MKKSLFILAFTGSTVCAGLAQTPPANYSKVVMRVSAPPPPYPYQARATHVQGHGVITVSFDEHGKASSARMTKSTGSGILDSNSVAFALSNWKTSGGKKTTVTVPVNYRLR